MRSCLGSKGAAFEISPVSINFRVYIQTAINPNKALAHKYKIFHRVVTTSSINFMQKAKIHAL